MTEREDLEHLLCRSMCGDMVLHGSKARRVALVLLSPEFVYNLMSGWRTEEGLRLPACDLPIDAQVVSIDADVGIGCFYLLFEHKSFDLVQPNELIQQLDVICKQVLIAPDYYSVQ